MCVDQRIIDTLDNNSGKDFLKCFFFLNERQKLGYIY